MHGVLRGLYCPDSSDGTLAGFVLEDQMRFSVAVQAFVGPSGLGGEESFDFVVCTGAWLANETLPKGFAFLRSTLLVHRWEPDVIERAVGDLCLHTEGATWNDVAVKLSRFGLWEYDGWPEPPRHDPVRGGRHA